MAVDLDYYDGPCSMCEAWLRDDSQWDRDNPEVHEGVSNPRSSFSVRFEHGELEQVMHAAQAAGMKTGEFIRNAALAAARGEGHDDPAAALAEFVQRRGMRVTFEPMPGRQPGNDVA